jgi:hypothetical protein
LHASGRSVTITLVIKTIVMEDTVHGRASLARGVLAADAAFELVLAVLLLTEPFVLERWVDLPLPTWAIVGFGAVLVPVGIVLAGFARLERPPRRLLELLAALNAAGAVVFAVWAALDDDLGQDALLFVGAVVLGLALLAAVQLACLRDL